MPAEDPERPFEVPQTLNVEHGVFIVENLDTSELAAAGVREFCLDPDSPEAARRHRRLDIPDRPRLGGLAMASEHYDVIIIGTGAGGGTLAHRLAPSGKRILVLERGGYLPREPENWSSEEVFGEGSLPARRGLDRRPRRGAVQAAPAVLRGRQHQVLRRDPVPAARARLRAGEPLRRRVAGVADLVRRPRALLRARPSGCIWCTARPARTRPSRSARRRSRTRRCRTSRGSSSSPTTSRARATTRSICRSGSISTRATRRRATACAATASTASPVSLTARPTRTCSASGRRSSTRTSRCSPTRAWRSSRRTRAAARVTDVVVDRRGARGALQR